MAGERREECPSLFVFLPAQTLALKEVCISEAVTVSFQRKIPLRFPCTYILERAGGLSESDALDRFEIFSPCRYFLFQLL